MIDKIKCENRIGCDIHKELITMWNELQKGWIPLNTQLVHLIMMNFGIGVEKSARITLCLLVNIMHQMTLNVCGLNNI